MYIKRILALPYSVIFLLYASFLFVGYRTKCSLTLTIRRGQSIKINIGKPFDLTNWRQFSLCVCPLIDDKFRHNIGPQQPLTMLWRNLSSIRGQTHKKTDVSLLFTITKSQNWFSNEGKKCKSQWKMRLPQNLNFIAVIRRITGSEMRCLCSQVKLYLCYSQCGLLSWQDNCLYCIDSRICK